MSSLKVAEMSDEQLIYFFELWARGRRNVEEAKSELLKRLSRKAISFIEGLPTKENWVEKTFERATRPERKERDCESKS